MIEGLAAYYRGITGKVAFKMSLKGAWVNQSVQHPIIDLSSSLDLSL